MDNGDPRFKTCIVWTYLPLITTIFPLIGHVGVGNSKGITYDFASSYFVSKGKLAFNPPYKVYKLNIDDSQFNDNWDVAINETAMEYSQLSHNLLRNNCHHLVARVLNRSNYKGRNDWTAFSVFIMSCKAKYLGMIYVFKSIFPFVILVTTLVLTLFFFMFLP